MKANQQPGMQTNGLAARSAGKRDSTWRVIFRLLRFQRGYLWQTLLSILLGFCTIGASVGLMGTSGLLISKAALHPETILLVWVPIVGVRFFGLSRAAFRYAERYVSHDLTFRILKEIRVWLYERIEPLVPILWQNRRSGDVLATLTGDIDILQNLYIRGLAPIAIALLILLLTSALLWSVGVGAVGVFAGFYVLAAIGVPWLSHRLGYRAGVQSVRSKSRLYVDIQDTVEGLADVVGNGAEEKLLRDVQVEQTQLCRQQRRLAEVEGLSAALLLGFNHLAMLGVLYLTVLQVSGKHLSGVYLATMVLAALAAFEAVIPLPAAFRQLGECAEAGRRVFALADAKPAHPEPETRLVPSDANLSVSHLSFHYPGEERNFVLHDISFELPRGKHLAIVGATGAGKSTLLNLLAGLWQPTTGSLHLGGVDMQSVSWDELNKWYAVVEQSAYLFHDTVRGNVGLGKAGANLNEIRDAATKAQINQVIDALADGYNTQVGDFGARFSGGERQRLALARALLKDAPILLLDEPTTGLDTLTAQDLERVLWQVSTDKSMIYITHRLVNMEYFDEILVLEDGRITERGTHAELLNQRGKYRSMWEVERDRLDFNHVADL